LEARRREAMMRSLKAALRQPQAGEKQMMGFVEKVECSNKGTFMHFKTASEIIKLSAASPQSVQIRSFTPDASQLPFGCAMKPLDIPVVFTFKDAPNPKTHSSGEIISLDFVPKSFVLD
jgi:hypothetical protein